MPVPKTVVATPNPASAGSPVVITGAGYGGQASLSTAQGANKDITWTSVLPGTNGNAITIAYVVSGANTPLSVAVATKAITVNVATTAGSAANSTADQIIAAVAAYPAAAALVTGARKAANDGTGIPGAMTATNLTGGTTDSQLKVELVEVDGGPVVDMLITPDNDGNITTSGVDVIIPQSRDKITVNIIEAGSVVASTGITVNE